MDTRDPFRFYVMDNESVTTEAGLAVFGFDTPEKITEMFGDTVSLREVWFKPSTGALELAMIRKCQKPDQSGILQYDPLLEQYARIEVVVDKWNGFAKSPTMEYAFDMHPNIIRVLNEAILAHMYPNLFGSINFTKASSKLQESSAPEKPAG